MAQQAQQSKVEDVEAQPSPILSREPSEMSYTSSTVLGPIWGGLMLLSGTMVTVVCKILFTLQAEGITTCKIKGVGETTFCQFNKAWFTVLCMKIGMSSCILFHLVAKARQDRLKLSTSGLRAEGRDVELVEAQESVECEGQVHRDPTWHTLCAIALPSFLDLLNVVLSNIGLVWVSSSIYQMSRGSVVVFSAVFSVLILKRKILRYQLWAMICVCAAVAGVGFAGIMESGTGQSSLSQVMVGLALILFSQIVLGLQIVVEEQFLTEQGVSPLQLVAYEGLWGLALMVVLVPILTYSPDSSSPLAAVYHEDFVDSIVRIRNSPKVLAGCIAYSIIVAVYNLAGMAVTKYLNAICRSILEACRTLGVWAVDLLLFYVLQMKDVGEPWTAWSVMELVGFVLLVYGTMSFKNLLPVPCARESQNESV